MFVVVAMDATEKKATATVKAIQTHVLLADVTALDGLLGRTDLATVLLQLLVERLGRHVEQSSRTGRSFSHHSRSDDVRR